MSEKISRYEWNWLVALDMVRYQIGTRSMGWRADTILQAQKHTHHPNIRADRGRQQRALKSWRPKFADGRHVKIFCLELAMLGVSNYITRPQRKPMKLNDLESYN
eukprot:scaffold11654_cov45-Prasinocladus_malaysianus.AAC.1